MATKKPDTPSIADGSKPYGGWPDDVRTPPEEGGGRSKKKRAEPEKAELTMNSLMDIVTIILVYLIKSFASSPIEVKDPAIKLPMSTSQESTEEAAVVMVTGPMSNSIVNGVTVPTENTPAIVVDDKPVLLLDRAAFAVPDAQLERQFVIKPLRDALKKVKEAQEISASIMDEGGVTGKIIIIADKMTPYKLLTQLLITSGEAGFGEFKFAIVKMEVKKEK